MKRPQPSKSTLKESTIYDNCVDRTSLLKVKPPSKVPRKQQLSSYALKVHLRSEADCHTFARLLRRTLRRDVRSFHFTATTRYKRKNWKYVDSGKVKSRKPSNRRRKNRDWFYEKHWAGMPAFIQNAIPPYITLTIRFRNIDQYVAFARLIKQRISPETKSIWFPRLEREENIKKRWLSKSSNVAPRYPIYIVSKGRADTRLTSRCLERMKVPYYIVIEPQEFDAYSCVIDKSKILVAPFSNHGDGSGRARNWCWDHAISIGEKRHWVLDDNISDFYRLHENKKIRVGDGAIFRAAEDFVDRYENVRIAGFQYLFFVVANSRCRPFTMNTRIYSCLLIDNKCKHRWRGRYNEDVELCLRLQRIQAE